MCKTFLPLTFLLTLLLLAACRSSQSTVKDTATTGTATTHAATATTETAAYVARVKANAQTAKTVTARIKMNIDAAGKDVSLGGTLRMKRDDVVQLSLTLLGFEVARMEFSPKDVLLIDRYNHRFVRATYADVSFLRQSSLDFSALQALFWGELFVPGKSGKPSATDFRLSTSGGYTLLAVEDAGRLDYDFLTQTAAAVISSVTVRSSNAARAGKFQWQYGDYTTLAGKPFPASLSCAVTGLGKDFSFSLALSHIGNDTDWTAHTELSSKYKEIKADDLLGGLLK